MSEVAIVILNWNGKKFLEKFLPGIIRYSSGKGKKIIVADNASNDDSVKYLNEHFPEVQLIILDRNYGFAEGYNRALMEINADYILFLNSDVAVTENWLEPLIREMDSNPLIAGCSPKIKDFNQRDFFEYAGAAGGFIDKYGYAFCRGRIFDSLETDYGQYDNTREVFWVTGACMIMRAELFKHAGGFDKSYFAHFEEIDLCWRLKNRGYRFEVVPKSVVFHVGGGTLPASNPKKTYLNFRNNLYTLFKNVSPEKLTATIFKRLLLDGLSALRFLGKLKLGDFFAILKSHIEFFSKIPSLRKFRKQEKNFVKSYTHNEIYEGSLVKDYFIKSKKSFNRLEWRDLN